MKYINVNERGGQKNLLAVTGQWQHGEGQHH